MARTKGSKNRPAPVEEAPAEEAPAEEAPAEEAPAEEAPAEEALGKIGKKKVVAVIGRRKVGSIMVESVKCDDGCTYDREVK